MSKITKLLAFGFLLVVVFNFVTTVRRLSRVRQEIGELRENVTKLEQERNRLLAVKSEVEKDEFIEKEAREKLGVGREGETILVLPNEKIINQQLPVADKGDRRVENWQKWLEVFGW